MFIDGWMDKEDIIYIYIYTHIHTQWTLAIKKDETMPFAATWMDLEIIILSEVSQKEKTKAVWYHLVWNLKYNTNEGLPWLRLCTSSAGGTSSIPGWGTKIPQSLGRDQKVIKLNMTQTNLSMKQKQTHR